MPSFPSSPEALAALIASQLPLLHAAVLASALLLVTALQFVNGRLHANGACSRRRVAQIGIMVMLYGAAGFTALALAVNGGSALVDFDDALVGALASSLDAHTLHLFARLTRFGDTETLTALGVTGALLLMWRRQHLLAATWVAAIAGNSLLNVSLKAVFQRVRPVHEHGYAAETSWSFPSGHASGTLVAYGVLAWVALRLLPARWHLPVLWVAVSIALTTGFSRIVLQVHFASDVLAGLCSGSAWLALCITVAEWIRRRAPQQPDGTLS